MPEMQLSEAALEHLEDDDPDTPPLYGTTQYVERTSRHRGLIHMCRDDIEGAVLLLLGNEQVLELDEEDVRWLAGVFVAALDNWPRQG